MQSRARKYRKSFDNYEQAIEKQLNDDFQVCEYLNQNKLQGNNMEEYLKLFNSLQVTKNQKKTKCESLRVKCVKMSTDRFQKNLQTSKVENWGGIKEEFVSRYQEAQIRTSNQLQVKNNLWKQILQTKKSLNLLKGDIGHLVGRNESANLLQSKIMKVKIVANDQLKRVNLAFTKDKDQIKIRGQMQKKFNKKLKNVSMFQDSTLTRLKRNYLDTMVKKKEIHDRLNYIQKVGASINETGDKQKIKNKINRNTMQLYKCFQKLKSLILAMPQLQKKYGQSTQEIHSFVADLQNHCNSNDQYAQKILAKSLLKSRLKSTQNEKQISSSDLDIIKQENLKNFEEIIKEEHRRISDEIQKQTSEYNWQVKKSEQMVVKLQDCNEEIAKIQENFADEISSKYILTREIREEYSDKLKKFIKNLKTIFTILQYIQKNLNYSSQTQNPIKKQPSSRPLSKQTSSNTPKNSQSGNLRVPIVQSKTLIPSDKSLAWMHKSYISELYKIYYFLLKDQEDNDELKLENVQGNIFQSLRGDVESWLDMIKDEILSPQLEDGKQFSWHMTRIPFTDEERNKSKLKIQKKPSKMRDSRVSQLKTPKLGVQTEEQEAVAVKQQDEYNFDNYRRHHTVHRQDNVGRMHSFSTSNLSSEHSKFLKTTNGFGRISSQKHSPSSSTNLVNLSKLKHFSQTMTKIKIRNKAMRIKFLQDLDQDYYKMLKSTIKMEKQNTRKNYQFLRTFKRAKYSSRDQILQEKRFECSFSMLFAGKKSFIANEAKDAKNKKSCFFNSQNTENRVSNIQNSQGSRNIISSSKFIKSSGSTLNLNEKSTQELKENVRKIKNKIQGQKAKQIDKRHLSIQMKDIINLV